ncbi:MAG: exo-alpha-sialidase [Rhodospirillales bacterium]|jgi:hypothetical protein|nr:exo-alpha-sialidase [Rhodospirillales bacterium]
MCRTFLYALFGVAASLLAGGCAGPEQQVEHQHSPTEGLAPEACLQDDALPSLLCAEVPTPFVDSKGQWWVVWAQRDHVYMATSSNLKEGFSSPLQITSKPLPVDKNGENRPKIIVAKNADIYVSFTTKGQRKYTGAVYFSRSIDGGKSFSEPMPITDEDASVSQRFDSLAVTPSGRIYLAWLDKREWFSAVRNDEPYRGISLYYTWSDNRGESFAVNTKSADHTCECCRTAMALDGEKPVIAWRHMFEPNIRDHAIMQLGEKKSLVRISEDRWAIDGCPHHGPALSITDTGDQHIVWYTDGEARSGLFYAYSGATKETFTAPFGFGNIENQASHPDVLSTGQSVFLTWKEFTGEASELYFMQSADGGQTWSTPLRIASSNGPADHPFLVVANGWVHASWSSMVEGWRSMRLAPVVENQKAGAV